MNLRRLVDFIVGTAILIAVAAIFRAKEVSAQDFPAQNSASPDAFSAPAIPGQQNAPGSADAANDPNQPTDPNTEVLTRGAVHEAFAQPVVFNAVPGTVVPTQPPEPVEEMPPEQKPAGDHVQWMSGYWTWEADQQKYVWCSGIWRSVPAGMEWVPGYWTQAEGGWRWVGGYWNKTNVAVNYLPKPNDSLENGPVGVAPGPNYVWIPGVWVWRGTHYAWRPGFWAVANPDWIWMPAHYVWTPSGYLFVEGHWDYAVERRGVIFAPVVFRPGVVITPGYVYSPAIAMDFSVCTGCLFCRPGFGCYCFGDYYGGPAVTVGIYPWFAFGRVGYDPLFAYYSWHFGPAWRDRLVVDYRFRLAHFDARPPRTFLAMRLGGGPVLALHINLFAARGGGMRFERISAARRAEIHRAVREQRAANARRMAAESRGREAAQRAANEHQAAQRGANQRQATQRNQQTQRGRQPQRNNRSSSRSNSRSNEDRRE
jgi:WXXGXW repeat (2 copies)